MSVVIIAGGVGSRLWPLSTPNFPKHLLKITNQKSLLQNTYDRAKLITDDIYILSEVSHVEHIYSQFPQMDRDHIIVEPGRRGTASCVIAALAKITNGLSDNQPVIFMHSDHHISNVGAFIVALKAAEEAAKRYKKIVLLGIKPTFAATGFGYIEKGSQITEPNLYKVLSFKEKPDSITAQTYLSSKKYLWNMGYFTAIPKVFEDSIKQYVPNLWEEYLALKNSKNTADYNKIYLSLENRPIDTALIEKAQDLLVESGEFDWMDVGSYPDVHEVNVHDKHGNTLQGKLEIKEVSNSYIRNDTGIPMAVVGLDNVIVVSTPEGILVANKEQSQSIGDVSKSITEK